MSISLFAHNREAYDEAVFMLKQTGKAAVIHPTGTGKSFIGLKFAEDYPERKICWLSPSEYIYRTQLENWKRAGGEEPRNVEFLTYAKLMTMEREELERIDPFLIILDEFHRCGAEKWGEGVQEFLSLYPSVWLLGLSATHIRYLDNQRDMAQELFDGNVASEMTLGEAIVRGILNPPTYVLSVYAYQKDLNSYQRKIRNAKSRAVRDEADQYLEALRRALDKADGLDVTFDKYMTDRTGKYLVFCSNVEHMYEMMDHVPEWFHRVDREPHVYYAYADQPETSRAFAEFKADGSEHLKLLFCIDMLNEGIHVDDVSGVILLRPTVSPIIYKQQIGRAFSAGSRKGCVIFDVAMNVENLYSIGTVEQEMREAMAYYRSTGENCRIVTEHFKVYDELQECRKLLEKLEDTLGASWDTMYRFAKTYFEQNENLEVPRHYKTEAGYNLGNWIFTQRKIRAGEQYGTLTEDRIARLDEIGMVWDSVRDLSWKRNYAEAKKWFEEHGNLNVAAETVTGTGFRLGAWINNLRTYRKNGIQSAYLIPDRIKALNEIGMVWSVTDFLWERNLSAAVHYYEEHGNLEVPTGYCTPEGIRLGRWIGNLRSMRNGGSRKMTLTEEQIQSLDEIGMQWTNTFQRKWDVAYEEARTYWQENGNLNPPVQFVTESGLRLGRWVRRQRDGKSSLTQKQIEKLSAIGMVWNTRAVM